MFNLSDQEIQTFLKHGHLYDFVVKALLNPLIFSQDLPSNIHNTVHRSGYKDAYRSAHIKCKKNIDEINCFLGEIDDYKLLNTLIGVRCFPGDENIAITLDRFELIIRCGPVKWHIRNESNEGSKRNESNEGNKHVKLQHHRTNGNIEELKAIWENITQRNLRSICNAEHANSTNCTNIVSLNWCDDCEEYECVDCDCTQNDILVTKHSRK